MAHAEHTVKISRPAEQVFDFVADGANNPRWRSSVIEVERSNHAAGVGAVWRQLMKGPGGRKISGDYRITVSERPRRLAFEVISGPARPTGTYRFDEVGAGQTLVTFELDLVPSGLMRILSPMIAAQVRREVATLDELKRVLEG